MSAISPPIVPLARRHDGLPGEILRHLDAQIASARGLLGVVLEQGAAIRERDVTAVVRLAGILRGEMGRRQGYLNHDGGANHENDAFAGVVQW